MPLTIDQLEQDFLAWSGGFPPDSEQQIYVYLETALPYQADEQEARDALRNWMERES